MKILCAILAAIFIIFLLPQNKPIFADVCGEHVIYVGADGSDCVFITLSDEEIKAAEKSLKNIKGEHVSFFGENTLTKILTDYEAIKVLTEDVQNIDSSYYYSKKISGYKTIKGEKVNLHVVKSNGKIIVGTPIIYGGY